MNDITLVRESVEPGAYVLKVTATSTVDGLTSKIFVYHAHGNGQPLPGDIFECVASLAQLNDVPEDAPVMQGENIIPFYRTNVLEFVLRSAHETEQLWDDVQEHVQDLVDNYRSSRALATQATVVIS